MAEPLVRKATAAMIRRGNAAGGRSFSVKALRDALGLQGVRADGDAVTREFGKHGTASSPWAASMIQAAGADLLKKEGADGRN